MLIIPSTTKPSSPGVAGASVSEAKRLISVWSSPLKAAGMKEVHGDIGAGQDFD